MTALPTPASAPGVAHLEQLLRARKLDRTLTSTRPAVDETSRPFELAAVDARLDGGLPCGQLSEIVGPPSSGRTSLAWTWLGAASRCGETVALIDTFDRFDPASGVACGIDLTRLLWVRGQAVTKTAGAIDPAWLPGVRAVTGPGTMVERTIDRALKALNLVLQSGLCAAVVMDLADVPLAGLRRIPATTWLRLQRVIAEHDTTCLLVAPVPLARSAGGVSIRAGGAGGDDAAPKLAKRAGGAASPKLAERAGGAASPKLAERAKAGWSGAHDRARRFAGLDVAARIVSPRRRSSPQPSAFSLRLAAGGH